MFIAQGKSILNLHDCNLAIFNEIRSVHMRV